MAQDATAAVSAAFEATLAKRDRWLTQQIRQLSVDVLGQGTFTCTECGEIAGDYIIHHDNQELRLSTPETYAFLKFILGQS